MLQLSLAGRLGRDAEHKTTQGGTDLCSFAVATDIGFGENKQTVWVDVTKWGKGAQGLSSILRKGSAVAVTGEMSMREHNGKTYVQCRADNVTILNTPQGSQGQSSGNSGGNSGSSGGGWNQEPDDTDVPF